jgi:hypothetical protein
MLRAPLLATVTALALGGIPAGALAARTSFGADLSAEANDPAICGEGFYPSFVVSSSCTWFSAAPGASFYAPATGTVTAVRVKAGAVGGQMQVVVMRSLYQNKAGDPEHPFFSCCFVEAYGPVFEAKAKAITTVTSALPMLEEATPPQSDLTSTAAGDFLAISILAPNVPIPAFVDEQSKDGGFYPSPTSTTFPAPSSSALAVSASPTGAEMLMNADLETRPGTAPPAGGPPSGAAPGGVGASPGGGAPGVALNQFALARRPAAALAVATVAITVRGPLATIPLQCLVLDCAGLLTLQSKPAIAARRGPASSRPLSYGAARFALKAGSTGRVKVRLSAHARRLLAHRRRLVVWANIRFSSGGVAPSSVRITLRRASASAASRAPKQHGPREYGCPLFPASNSLNRDISHAPVDPNSASYIASIGLSGHLHPDFGSNPAYGIPYTVVGAQQPKVPIRFSEYGEESDSGPYPIPLAAPIEGAGEAGDKHVLVLQQGSCRVYELYSAQRHGSGWEAGSGAVFNLRSNALRPEGWTSADAAGLPILPLLVRYPEVRAGRIEHALRMTVSETQSGYIHPATHLASSNPGPSLPPMGLRLRLKASYSLSGFHGESLVILRALQHYGLIVADNGSSWYITGAPDPRWNDADLEQIKRVPGAAFEVVRSGPIHHRG